MKQRGLELKKEIDKSTDIVDFFWKFLSLLILEKTSNGKLTMVQKT